MRELVDRVLGLAGANARVSTDQFLAMLVEKQVARPVLPGSWCSPALRKAVAELFIQPQLTAEMALQAACLCGDLLPLWVMPEALENLQRWWETHERRCDLEGFARLWTARGNPAHALLAAFGHRLWDRPWPNLEDGFLQGYLRSQEDWLLTRSPRLTSLRLLTRLEPPTERLLETVWQCALDEPRKERELAQNYLQRAGRAEAGLLQALRHSQAPVRQRAAEWAGRIRLLAALEPLGKALAKEKVERARMAQMEALRLLGAPLDLYLNRPALLAEARQRLQKEEPEWLHQIPPAQLSWKADGQIVEVDLLKGWLLSAARLKQPEPSGLLTVVAPYLADETRTQWGLDLLHWWIARDTHRTYTPAEVEALLPAQISSLKSLYALIQQPRSEQALEAEARRALEFSTTGSAIELKGLLAVAGAFAGEAALEPVKAYLRTWYGLRAAQCKALLCMLGHVEGAAVVQYLLDVARRFRTKGIQQEAQRVLCLRAERAGWTVEDLADLNLPSGGLDEKGQLRLESEGRELVASLQPDLSWQLRDGSGKSLKALPASQDKLAAGLYKSAQKTVKELKKSLSERLFEAMCCARSWNFAAWDASLRRHPIAARLLQGLVWLARREAEQVSFRPDLDGSLLSAEQDCVQLDSSWSVELAHPLQLSSTELAAWHTHLADYLLLPCFPQLRRPSFEKPPVEGEQLPWYGHLVNSFKLRNRAQALGYLRAPAQDGGIFDEYRKNLASSGWCVCLKFSGSALPETSHPVALLELNFEHQNRRAGWPELPPLLYSEAMADVQEMAQEGSGFAPDWQQKATFS